MKKICPFIIMVLTLTFSPAQNVADGLRYSDSDNIGTARFTALSGAMGALGGDFSALSINPAGGAVFLTSSLTVSASLYDMENDATYFNNREKAFSGDVLLNQLGGIFVIKNQNEDAAFKKFTIGLNFDTTNNFENELYIAGRGRNSVGDFFLGQAQGIPLNLLQLQSGESISELYQYLGETQGTMAQNAFLGYQAFLFDPVDPTDPNNSAYLSNIAGNNFNQEYAYLSGGYNSKFSINFATQITDKLFLGINLNTHSIDFTQSSFLFETNSNPGSTVSRVGFENNLSVTGAGFSAQIGAIATIDNFRLGLSLDTPTWYQISEETTQYLESRHQFEGQTLQTVVDPHIVNVYEDYNLSTPAKVTASAAYVFGQQGLLSFDYSYKDYGSIEFRTLNDSFDSYFNMLNSSLEKTLKGASTFKAGAEYRLNQLSLRGGFHYEESPYENSTTVGDLTGFSLGTGYNFGRCTVDIAYSRSDQDRTEQLYPLATDTAEVNTIYNNLVLSVGFIF